ncbi:hypothetical protein EJ03DRAFT_65990 [Teratosphaeria nubilosa]|uniref:Uncharacterized protein n=1 Tax=Teratosphaeria nubilosa TaxID=161662 RepID=A0A6G1LBV7_9PEZI|nr:hypothetical protein EJ03DRAFT_65990 [Teratosphaeria nubilosa]
MLGHGGSQGQDTYLSTRFRRSTLLDPSSCFARTKAGVCRISLSGNVGLSWTRLYAAPSRVEVKKWHLQVVSPIEAVESTCYYSVTGHSRVRIVSLVFCHQAVFLAGTICFGELRSIVNIAETTWNTRLESTGQLVPLRELPTSKLGATSSTWKQDHCCLTL